MRNSIIAGNSASSGPDVSSNLAGDFISQGHNLIGDGTGSTEFTAMGDTVGTGVSPIDPLLESLADYGGPSFTHALKPSSPAINAGDLATPGSGGTACEAADQRGAPRSACDIGADEFNALPAGEVPSLSQWALIGLAVLLGAAAYFKYGRRRIPRPA